MLVQNKVQYCDLLSPYLTFKPKIQKPTAGRASGYEMAHSLLLTTHKICQGLGSLVMG